MNYEKLLNRKIKVLWYNPVRQPDPEANIFLKNIPNQVWEVYYFIINRINVSKNFYSKLTNYYLIW